MGQELNIKQTSMAIKPSTLLRLRGYKVHPRESDDECLGRLLDKVIVVS